MTVRPIRRRHPDRESHREPRRRLPSGSLLSEEGRGVFPFLEDHQPVLRSQTPTCLRNRGGSDLTTAVEDGVANAFYNSGQTCSALTRMLVPRSRVEEVEWIAVDAASRMPLVDPLGDHEHAERIARRIRAGTVHVNGGSFASGAPFGGYKQSGNGREGGRHGFEEYLEIKALLR